MSKLRIPDWGEILSVSECLGQNSEASELWHGLKLWLPMQEGGGAAVFDASGFGRNGILTLMDPATDWMVGPLGRGLSFDGTNDYVAVSSYQGIGTGALTTALWFATTSASVENAALSWGNSAAAGGQWLQEVENGVLWLRCGAGNTVTGASGLNDGLWHHWVVTKPVNGTSAGVRMWLDGQEVSVTPSGTTTINPTGIQVEVGRLGRVPSTWWTGAITDVSIWDRALPQSAIAQLYADPWAMGRLRRRVFPAAVAGGGESTIQLPTLAITI